MLAELLGGLSVRERQVIEERLAGRSFLDIGRDLGVTRQAVQICERRALGRLGLRQSLEVIVNHRERAGRSVVLVGRSRGTAPEGMGQPGRGGGKTRDRGERLSDRLWAELEAAERDGRELSAERWAYYADRIARAMR